MSDIIVHVTELNKSYGGVQALRDVTLDLRAGEIHALCGENGAGKSTLIKCLSGVTVPDKGRVTIGDQPLRFGNVRGAESAGIAVIHQESTAFPDLNTLDNIFVGREPRKLWGCLLDRAKMRCDALGILDRLGHQLDVDRHVGELSVADRQIVAMARALSHECRLLVMDEPTASLSARETKVLLDLVRRLRDEGVTILYVSHRLEEILDLADRVSVLRDGQHIATRDVAETSKTQLIQLMVGRDLEETPSHVQQQVAAHVRLEVRRLTSKAFHDVSFSVRAGEIVGLGGLVGAGRSEVVRAVFGIDGYASGQVCVDGKSLPRTNVQESLRRGMALVPEDRQHEGIVLPMTVAENISLTVLKRLTRWGLVKRRAEMTLVNDLMIQLQVKAPHPNVPAETLSGGNQQKLVLGKWLASEPTTLILDEPTRGVDVGAKAQVHDLIRKLSLQGMATLVISSEIPELLALCQRVIVMCEGRIAGEVTNAATPEEILRLALPVERRVEGATA